MTRPSFPFIQTLFRARFAALRGLRADRGAGCVRRAFSLVEILVVALVLGICFSAALGLIVFHLWAQDHSRLRLSAAQLAKSRLEFLRSSTYNDLPYLSEKQLQVNAGGIPDPDGQFFRTTVIGADYRNTRTAAVRVVTEGKLGKPGVAIALTTILLDREQLVSE